MNVLDKSVIELVAIYHSVVKRSDLECIRDIEVITFLLDLDTHFYSEEELKSLPVVQRKLFKAKSSQALEIVGRLLEDDKAPNWWLYGINLDLDCSVWKPLCASENHSPRYRHMFSNIVLEADWKASVLRCKQHRYRFYFMDDKGSIVLPALLLTDYPSMAQLYVTKIEKVSYGSSMAHLAEMLSLFATVKLRLREDDTGEIEILGFGKNLVLEVNDWMLLLERDELVETYLTEPFQRDNVELLFIIRDLLKNQIV